MKVVAVADTHTVLWYLFGDPRLSASARDFIPQIAADGSKIAVSAITMVELVYLIEKGRFLASAYQQVLGVLADPEHVFLDVPVSSLIADSLRNVNRDQVADRPDRIIAATGIHFNVPVISSDRRTRASNIVTIW